MAVSAAPPGPQKAAVQAWNDAFTSIEKDLKRWQKRLAAGQPPLKAGEAARLRSLIATVQNLTNLDNGTAQVAAAVINQYQGAAQASLAGTLQALPAHTVAAAQEAAAAAGYTVMGNEKAIQAVVNGQVGQLTADYMTMNAALQDHLLASLTQSVAAGEAPADLAARIMQAAQAGFVGGQARATMIARTTLAKAYDGASSVIYQGAAAEGLIKGWKWLANGPDPCYVCRCLNGQIFKADEPMFRHPNCTCQNVPVLIDEKGKPGQKVGGNNTAYPFSDLTLVESPSGWKNWHVKKPKQKELEAALKAKAKATYQAKKAALEAGAKFLGQANGKWVASVGDSNYVWSFGRGKWVNAVTGKAATWDARIAMNKAYKAATNKQKPKAPPTPVTKYLGQPDNKWHQAEWDGQTWQYNFLTEKWQNKQGLQAPPAGQKAMAQAVKDATGSTKPPAQALPKPQPKQGFADGKQGKAVVQQKAPDQAPTGTYGGHDFYWDGQNWIHGPTKTIAGPNSTLALNAAANNGGIAVKVLPKPAPPKPASLPDWVKQGDAPEMDQAAIDKAVHLARGNVPPSPIKGVTNEEWRQAWNDVSDGKPLNPKIQNATGWKSVISAFRRYTRDYNKEGFQTARGAQMFQAAPKYARPTWRGIKLHSEQGVADWLTQNPPGAILDLRGGSSFSFSKGVAQGFRGNTSRGVMIEVRGGTSGLPLRGLSAYKHEDELLVNSQLKVVEVRHTADGVYVIAEEVGKYGGK